VDKLKEKEEMKETIMGLVILAYVVPFAYMFLANIADVSKRLVRVVNTRVRPVVTVMTKSFVD
jgi:hypothetical protein